MIIITAQRIHAKMPLELPIVLLFPSSVTTMTHAQRIPVILPKAVYLPLCLALMVVYAPQILVIVPLESVFILLLLYPIPLMLVIPHIVMIPLECKTQRYSADLLTDVRVILRRGVFAKTVDSSRI
jgi:hypothetical protein